ncbi:hypothetical protein RF11_08648 [Thelohanellus kitauei]|uniref:Uncharacterized protein n=1 Tax=Thelohanellus kitauei TaxID=669202 RepID=A0A0C2JS30_THEKT|nr:hypothetical protein RF11_08648 [Thelohanellus kitauei]
MRSEINFGNELLAESELSHRSTTCRYTTAIDLVPYKYKVLGGHKAPLSIHRGRPDLQLFYEFTADRTCEKHSYTRRPACSAPDKSDVGPTNHVLDNPNRV